MGSCQYQYNPSEIYQAQHPGMGVESHCGGRTYPAVDEPEMVPMTVRDLEGNAATVYTHTGNFLPREKDDPYCPRHGGTPEPPPRVLTNMELLAQGETLELERRRFVTELERAGVAIPEALQVSAAIKAPASEEVSQ